MNEILAEARRRGVTRLCHFTKSANLAHILATGELKNAVVLRGSSEGFRATDPVRLDGHADHINCSIEYPNTWYLDKVRAEDPNFTEWVILDLDVSLLATPGAKFCPYNAARQQGAAVRGGFEAFATLFDPQVMGNTARTRQAGHPAWWPTDDQAEVLLPDAVPLERVRGIVCREREQAELEHYRLAQHLTMEALIPPLSVAPVLFDKYELSKRVRAGRRPAEQLFMSRNLAE